MTISWSSNAPSIITNAGAVTRPTAVGDSAVLLTALISKGSVSDQKVFSLQVKLTDQGAVNVDAAALSAQSPFTFGASDTASTISQDFSMPVSALTGRR